MSGGKDNDAIHVEASKLNRLRVDLGGGAENSLRLQDTSIHGGVIVNGREGVDRVDLNKVEVGGPTRIRTGNGADAIRIVDSTFARSFAVRSGGGDDVLEIEGSKFAGRVSLAGGEDVDTLVESNNEFTDAFFEDFEL